MKSLPSVDLGPFMVDEGVVVGEAPTAAQSTAAAAIHSISTNHGFMHITNWGMTRKLNDEAFAAAEELFALPEAEKMEQLNRITPQTNIGYAPYGLEMLNRSRPPDLKECFNVRFEPAHKNDFRGCPQRFEAVALKVQEVIAHAAKRYALAAALALGLETDYFLRTLDRMDLCTTRYLHYPPCDIVTSPDASVSLPIRVGEHTDFGAYTFLLLKEGALGLQIKSIDGGEVGGAAGGEAGGWQDVLLPAADPNASTVGALVNTGAALARWTNDTWKATAHRVIVPNEEVASRDRYSIACFIDPDAEARVAVDARFVAEGEQPKYPETTGLEYLLGKLRQAQGVTS